MRSKSKLLIASALAVAVFEFCVPAAHAESFCSLTGYKAASGLTADVAGKALVVTWEGANSDQLRLRMTIDNGTPTIQELAVKHAGGGWSTVGSNLTPEFDVVTGRRRLDQEAFPALKKSVGNVTQEVLDHYKWDAFWDAPMRIPGDEIAHGDSTPPPDGIAGTDQLPLPRTESEVTRSTASYQASSCEVKTDGQRLEITFPGVDMGIFSGRLQYTVYKGTNLIRQEVLAKTDKPDIAYKYNAGLKGFTIKPQSNIVWRDTANVWQNYELDAAVNTHPATVQAANRLLAVETGGGSIAVFPPPHNFFWTREISVNLGYNWYSKDSNSSYSIGIRQAEDEIDPAYAGRGPEDRRQNFALYSARPGTEQNMPIYLLVGAGSGQATLDAALTYTRNDHYQALPGYWIMARHFHTNPVPRLLGLGGLDVVFPDFELARAAGLNVFGPVSGGGIVATGTQRIGPRQNPGSAALAANAGPTGRPRMSEGDRLEGQALYYEMARLQSRPKDRFLVMPNEELGGGPLPAHDDILISHPTYWVDGRKPGEPLVEDNPKYGKVYHIGSPADLMQMTHAEDAFMMMPHPNTKASAGYPKGFKDKDYFIDSRYRGIGFRWGMGVDRSEKRLSDYRVMPLFDEMNNWVADLPTPPKYVDAITETYEQGPGDDFYANNPVTYVKTEGTPGLDNWKPIIDAMMKGNFFVTSGEVLIPDYSVEGSGDKRTITADIEWTFPLEFAEVVWGDGQKTDRQIIPLTDLPAFGKHHFAIPFDASGKKWVRFAVWDSAGNGAFVQPIKLPSATAPETSSSSH